MAAKAAGITGKFEAIGKEARLSVPCQEAVRLQAFEPASRVFSRAGSRKTERDNLFDGAIHPAFATSYLRERSIGDRSAICAQDRAGTCGAAVRAGQGGVNPTDVARPRIAVGYDGFDRRSSMAQQPEGPRAKEALTVLRDAIEKNQARQYAAFGRIGKAGVARYDGVGRRHGEDRDAFGPCASPE